MIKGGRAALAISEPGRTLQCWSGVKTATAIPGHSHCSWLHPWARTLDTPSSGTVAASEASGGVAVTSVSSPECIGCGLGFLVPLASQSWSSMGVSARRRPEQVICPSCKEGWEKTLSDPLGEGGLCLVGRATQMLVAESVTVPTSDHRGLVRPSRGWLAGNTTAPLAKMHSALQVCSVRWRGSSSFRVFDFAAGERQKDLENRVACCPSRCRGSSGSIARSTGDWVFPLW